jgi:sugar lactone lactonase YvrE
VLVQDGEARLVADGLGYTNEVQVSPCGNWLYANETFGRRVSRFPIGGDGLLGQRETVVALGHGTFPDGLAFDQEGGLWITSLVSNRLLRYVDGTVRVVVDDADPAHVGWVEDAFLAGLMDRQHLDTVKGRSLRNTSSIAFGGPDLRTAYMGCLSGEQIASFVLPVAGVPPVHWEWE